MSWGSDALDTAVGQPVFFPRFRVVIHVDDGEVIEVASHADAHKDQNNPFRLMTAPGVSQEYNPREAKSTIGNFSVQILDVDGSFTATVRAKIQSAKSLLNRKIELWQGGVGFAADDYVLMQTQFIKDVKYRDCVFTLATRDVQHFAKRKVFEPKTVNLSQDINSTATTIPVTEGIVDFGILDHPIWSVSQAGRSSFIKIDDEIIEIFGYNTTEAFVRNRGALGTVAADHAQDAKVEEYIYYENNAAQLLLLLLTGKRAEVVDTGWLKIITNTVHYWPSHWHAGIPIESIDIESFSLIGGDVWGIDGLILEQPGKIEAKEFIEKELLLLMNCYMVVNREGKLQLKRRVFVEKEASAIEVFDRSNVASYGDLQETADIYPAIAVQWEWRPSEDDYLRSFVLIDTDSVSMHRENKERVLQFKLANTTASFVNQMKGLLRHHLNTLARPAYVLNIEAPSKYAWIQVGDIVRVELEHIKDWHGDLVTLNRAFEVHKVTPDYLNNKTTFTLFAPTSKPKGATAAENEYVADAWFGTVGQPLSNFLPIAGNSLIGSHPLPAGDYYHKGPLTIPFGAEIRQSTKGTIRFFIEGFMVINGKIITKGMGGSGGNADQAGENSYIGATRGGGGVFVTSTENSNTDVFNSYHSSSSITTTGVVSGLSAIHVKADFNGNPIGLPPDLKGVGGSGGRSAKREYLGITTTSTGGVGGNGGGGLLILSRGGELGASAEIDLSGEDGTLSAGQIDPGIYGGTGGGGDAGAFIWLLDGTNPNPVVANQIIAKLGTSQTRHPSLKDNSRTGVYSANYGFAGGDRGASRVLITGIYG